VNSLSTDIGARLDALRAYLVQHQLDALIIPRADEYLGEYVPEHNERLRWATGFAGSAGMAVILPDTAAIFVDGRYTQQVREQVPPEHFEYLHLIEQPPIDWLAGRLAMGQRIGADARTFTASWWRRAEQQLRNSGLQLIALETNPVDSNWDNRPLPTPTVASLHPERYTGRSAAAKRADIAESLTSRGVDAALVFAADSVAWLLNIRGQDVPHLPVVLGFAVIHADQRVALFTDPAKIPADFAEHCGGRVTVQAEHEADAYFATLADLTVLVDPDTSNAWSVRRLEQAGARCIDGSDPCLLPKACKNAVEIAGIRDAHIRDAVAEVRFLHWLDTEVAAGRLHNEGILSDQLEQFRAMSPLFCDTSFDTISASGPNAAMAHYRHSDTDPAPVLADTVYLFDSGAQYPDGTTDITRTVAIGTPTAEQQRMFTLVLKGHIALDQARFPAGTTGNQLDPFARQFLWQQGFDYDHGTGHGVGCYLSVHEGPQRIGKVASPALLPGMVVSNEPGYYKPNAYGIRCENLVLVVECEPNAEADKPLLGFDALTLVPFDTRLIDWALMTREDAQWLNRYHERVRNTLSPLLEGDVLSWLEAATEAQPIPA